MKSTGLPPCSAAEAVQRAKRIANKGGQYVLGTGDYAPKTIAGRSFDVPWTARGDLTGSDCAGFAISWCYKLRRHRPGFASGLVPDEFHDQSDVDDDLNCNSLLEDSMTVQEICELVIAGTPQLGDLLVYPSLRLKLHNGSIFKTIGHVGIVIGTGRMGLWDWMHPRYDQLDIAQCRGPNGRAPAVILTDGSIWSAHDDKWPKPAHRSRVVRMKP